jgi:hypothetical protein
MNETKQKLFDLLEEEQTKENAVPTSETTSSGRENKDVLKFIRKLDIQPGTNKVPTYIIYYQFAQWHQTQWRNLWGKEEFFRTFKKHFEQKRSGNQRFYMINDALDLSDEMYEKAKKYDQKYQKRNKKVKKIKGKVSCSE